MKYELDIFKSGLKIKDLFKSKLFIKSLNNFILDFKDEFKKFDFEILETIDLNNPYKSEGELFKKLNKIFGDEDIFMFYIRFLEKKGYIKHTKNENIGTIIDVFEYFINLTKAQENYPIDLVVSKVNTKVIDIALNTKIESTELKLISLGYKTIPNEGGYIDKIYEDEIFQGHMKVLLKDGKNYYYNKNGDFLKTSEGKKVSHVIYSSKTKQGIISKIIDEFNEEYVDGISSEDGENFDNFIEREIKLLNKSFTYFEFKRGSETFLLDENFEKIDISYVIENLLEGTIEDSDGIMLENENILKLLKYYEFNGSKYFKVSIEEPNADIEIHINSTQFKKTNEKNLFTFIIDQSGKILKEEETDIIITELHFTEKLAGKELLAYGFDNIFGGIEGFLDQKGKIVYINNGILCDFEEIPMIYKQNKYFKIAHLVDGKRKEEFISEKELSKILSNYIGIGEKYGTLYLEENDNVSLAGELIEKIFIKKNPNEEIEVCLIGKQKITKMSYSELINIMLKNGNEKTLIRVNNTINHLND